VMRRATVLGIRDTRKRTSRCGVINIQGILIK
jgi:hypothetical protein